MPVCPATQRQESGIGLPGAHLAWGTQFHQHSTARLYWSTNTAHETQLMTEGSLSLKMRMSRYGCLADNFKFHQICNRSRIIVVSTWRWGFCITTQVFSTCDIVGWTMWTQLTSQEYLTPYQFFWSPNFCGPPVNFLFQIKHSKTFFFWQCGFLFFLGMVLKI